MSGFLVEALMYDREMERKTRHRILIYPEFQGTLIAVNTLVLSVTFGIIGTQVHRVYLKLKDMGSVARLAPDHAFFGFVKYQAELVYWALFLGFALCLVVGTALIIYFSHRLAGPLVRMRSYLVSIQERGLAGAEPLKFRKRDYFSDLPDALNLALIRVEQDSHQSGSEISTDTIKRSGSGNQGSDPDRGAGSGSR